MIMILKQTRRTFFFYWPRTLLFLRRFCDSQNKRIVVHG